MAAASSSSVSVSKLMKLPPDILVDIIGGLSDPTQLWNTCHEAEQLGIAAKLEYQADPFLARFIPPLFDGSCSSFYRRTFSALTERAKDLGLEIDAPGVELGKLAQKILGFEQSLRDHALVQIFLHIPFPDHAEPRGPRIVPVIFDDKTNAYIIREWLKVEENRAFISTIQGLEIPGLGIKLLPNEMEFFTGLLHFNLRFDRMIHTSNWKWFNRKYGLELFRYLAESAKLQP